MSPVMKTYRVTAMMYQLLGCTVQALDEDEAIELAKRLANDGQLTDVKFSGGIDDYDAQEVTPATHDQSTNESTDHA